MENWAIQYPELEKEFSAIRISLEYYAHAHGKATLVSSKEKIFASIRKSIAAPAKIISLNPLWKRLAAACMVLLVGSIVLNLILYKNYRTGNKELAETLQIMGDNNKQMSDMKSDMSVIQSKYSMPLALKGMDNTIDATAKIFWMQDTHEVFVDPSNLPQAPEGMQYQFWGIVDGKPVDGGMILTGDNGKKYHIQKMKAFGKAEAFAISLEKAGGNPTPTKVVSMGKII